MLDTENDPNTAGPQPVPATTTSPPPRTRRRAASRPAGPPEPPEPLGTPPADSAEESQSTGETVDAAVKKVTARKATTKRTTAKTTTAKKPAKKSTAKESTADKSTAGKPPVEKTSARKTAGKKAASGAVEATAVVPVGEDLAGTTPEPPTAKKTARKRTTKRSSEPDQAGDSPVDPALAAAVDVSPSESQAPPAGGQPVATSVLFQPPDPERATRKRTAKKAAAEPDVASAAVAAETPPTPAVGGDQAETRSQDGDQADGDSDDGPRRRRRRGGRRRRKSSSEPSGESGSEPSGQPTDDSTAAGAESTATAESGTEPNEAAGSAVDTTEPAQVAAGSDAESSDSSRRRRRRRRRPEDEVESSPDDPADTVVRVRKPRPPKTEITSVEGSTRLEAKKQRRREGREAGRRRAPIASEAEFLARRESVERVMVIRQSDDISQIAVLEDRVLVEHYVARESQTSIIGNVYLGRVQNVLPSMEAAFIDIGKGRNGVLYAGEVNWDLMGNQGQPRKIESALKSGQSVLVQVTKDPIGHKGARLTSQVSLPGRYLVYVPRGGSNGISRKLADTERSRLKGLLKDILPDDAGVIIRTAAEGASEEELTRDVSRLTARWDDIDKKTKNGAAPALLYGEPDLTIKVVRDLFTEDFTKLVIDGDEAWETVHGYVTHVAPELADRLERWSGTGDVFASYRVDEQIDKGLDRKVWLPSGGSLVIDRTEAMTVVDVNTGKFTGSGGNLEETVTKNNLEAAEEIVRQLRLRDIGGIIVVDFIDMVLESNRDLVLRRLVECLGRDRTRHQVAEVTSLGLVQMTRKRIGTGLLEAFSEPCDRCGGRGLLIHHHPVESVPEKPKGESKRSTRRRRDERPDPTGNLAVTEAAGEARSEADARHVDQAHEGQIADTGAEADTGARADADTRLESGAVGQGGSAAPQEESPAAPRRTLLDPTPTLDDLPAAVTPRKRTRKRVTRPAGQPTPSA